MAPSRRRWLPWVLVPAGALGLVVACIGALAWYLDLSPEPVEVDPVVMADVQSRLDALRPDLEALRAPSGAVEDVVSTEAHCQVDDSFGGLLGQPEAVRRWDLALGSDAPGAFRAVVADLEAAGWELGTATDEVSTTQITEWGLAARRGGRQVTARVTLYPGVGELAPSLWVGLAIDGLEPCSQEG